MAMRDKPQTLGELFDERDALRARVAELKKSSDARELAWKTATGACAPWDAAEMLKHLRSEVDSYRTASARMDETIAKRQQNTAALEARIAELEAKVERLNSAWAVSRDAAATHQAEARNLRKDVAFHVARVTNANAAAADMSKALAASENKRAELVSRLEELTGNAGAKALSHALAGGTDAINSLERRAVTAEQALAESERKRGLMLVDITALRAAWVNEEHDLLPPRLRAALVAFLGE